jgi:hypothetical protein
VETGWEIGFELDRRWHRLSGEMEDSKKPALVELARVLGNARVDYGIIGGLALQLHQDEPRTTLDIDVAVRSYDALPTAELAGAGFSRAGDFPHSQNWRGPGGTPVQFTDDPALGLGISRTEERQIEGTRVRVFAAADLLAAKLRAASDPARRRSKRLQDLADAQALIERHSELEANLDDAQRSLLAGLLRP